MPEAENRIMWRAIEEIIPVVDCSRLMIMMMSDFTLLKM